MYTRGTMRPAMSSTMRWLESLPKVELHLHLEGAIPLDTLWTLIEKHGGDPSVSGPAALEERFRYHDFPHFIETWVWKNRFLREYEDFALLAEAVARDLASQNIRYVEAFFSPGDFARRGLTPALLAEAIRRGLDRVPAVQVRLVPDLIRDFGPQRAGRVLEEVAEARELGVIGVGLGGSEHEFPPEAFGSVFRRARELGLHTTAHAGEAAGPASVWEALHSLEVERIGHGVRAIEDPRLVEELARRRIPLEVCPISNLRTGVYRRIEEHPVRRLVDAGIPVCINTDDPMMFGNALAEEYGVLQESLGFTSSEILSLIETGIRSSWLDEEGKIRLLAEFQSDPAWTALPGPR